MIWVQTKYPKNFFQFILPHGKRALNLFVHALPILRMRYLFLQKKRKIYQVHHIFVCGDIQNTVWIQVWLTTLSLVCPGYHHIYNCIFLHIHHLLILYHLRYYLCSWFLHSSHPHQVDLSRLENYPKVVITYCFPLTWGKSWYTVSVSVSIMEPVTAFPILDFTKFPITWGLPYPWKKFLCILQNFLLE